MNISFLIKRIITKKKKRLVADLVIVRVFGFLTVYSWFASALSVCGLFSSML